MSGQGHRLPRPRRAEKLPRGLALPAPVRAVPRALPWLAAALAVLALLVAVALRLGGAPQAVVVPAGTAPVKLVARGQVQPLAQARIGALAGGVVTRLPVEVGEPVVAEQEVARVRGPNGTEVLTAPWRGTVTGLPAHLGDTVLPGAVVVMVGDLTRLQVETTDVDEFVIASVWPGQRVRLTVDALDGRALTGYVRTVGLQPQLTTSGDEHYPIVVDLTDSVPDLRPGMTVRVDFGS